MSGKNKNNSDDEDDDNSSSASSDCSFFNTPKKTKASNVNVHVKGKTTNISKSSANETVIKGSSNSEDDCNSKTNAIANKNGNDKDKSGGSINDSDDSSGSDSDSDSDDAFNFTRHKFGKGKRGTAVSLSATKTKRKTAGATLPSSSPLSPVAKKTKGDIDSDADDNDNGNKMNEVHIDATDNNINGESDSEIDMYNVDDDDDDDDGNEVSKKLALLTKRQEEEERRKNNVISIDSDDEVDIFAPSSKKITYDSAATSSNINNATNNTTSKNHGSDKPATAATVVTNQMNGGNDIDISLLDSDTDDDDDRDNKENKINNGGNRSNIHNSSSTNQSIDFSPSVNAALQRAKSAELQLKKAQVAGLTLQMDDDNYDGNDSDIEEIGPTKTSSLSFTPFISTAAAPVSSSSTKSLQPQQPTGPFLEINLRTNVQSAPKLFDKKLMHHKNNTVRFRTGTKIQKILDKYYALYPIAKHSTVKLMFDGLVMDVNKMISNYDLEDEDLVDVLVTIPDGAELKLKNELQSQKRPSYTTDGGSSTTTTYIKINTRIKGGDPEKTHIYQLKKTDPFDKLVKAYRNQHGYSSFKNVVLEYNNVSIKSGQSPSDLGLIDGCLVEICDETERSKQVNRMLAKSSNRLDNASSNTNGDSSSPGADVAPLGGVTVKVRINGDDKSIVSYGIKLDAPFQTVITKVCEKNKITEKDCKFEFDGQRLNPKATPEDEDLESNEEIVVEAQVDKKALTPKVTAPPVSSNKPKSNTSSSTSTTSQPPRPINVLTLRNNVKASKTKKFRLSNDWAISKMKEAYLKYYKKKGCRSVVFYHNSIPIRDLNQTFISLGINDMDILIAMENGRKL